MPHTDTLVNVLCVGLCCIDDFLEVHQYPNEDMDIRCISKFRQRGGNAANNCTVLSILGANPAYLGVIANSVEQGFIEDDFSKFNINFSNAIIANGSECPISCVILSQATGSRTVIHFNKNLPELTFQEFSKVNISHYTWIHFEGRNVSEVQKMMEYVQSLNENSDKKIVVSVELEKTREELKNLIHLADVIYISKEFALMEGCKDMNQALKKLSKLISPQATLICPWGDLGASAIQNGQIFLSPSYPPDRLVDTLGAGDTFVAATIYAMLCGESVEHSINFGCRTAGAKVGIKGWDNFQNSVSSMEFIQALKMKECHMEKINNEVDIMNGKI